MIASAAFAASAVLTLASLAAPAAASAAAAVTPPAFVASASSLAAPAVSAAAPPVATAVSAVTTGTVTRLGGANRYETSAAISAARFAPGVSVAYVATGAAYPDALSAGARAGADGAPVLLTSSNGIPTAIAAELTRLKPKRIVVVGEEAAVPPVVADALTAFTTGAVERRGGGTRYDTSAALSSDIAPGAAVVYLASGASYPDALAGAAAAGRTGGPVLLTQPDGLPAATEAELARLKPKRIVVLGGPVAVSDTVAARAAQITGAQLSRWGGADRFGTAATISSATAAASNVPVAFVATGMDYPDALSGSAAAGAAGAPLLLTKSTTIPPATMTELKRLNPARVVVLGGEQALSKSIAAQLDGFVTTRSAAKAGTLTAATELRAGSCLTAPSGGATLCLDKKLGLVATGATTWRAPVAGAATLRLGRDGNLVIYSATGANLWQTHTVGSGATVLQVQTDGDITLRTAKAAITWATMTAASSPVWDLPFEAGQQWSAGGPHAGTSSDPNQTWNALDLGQSSKSTSTRVVAIAPGVVTMLSCGNGKGYLKIDHGGGWQSAYYHLVNEQTQLVGTTVTAGTYLGDAARALPCGGGATFDHVHLSVRHGGTPVSVEGMTFGGYTVRGGAVATAGTWLDGSGRTVISTPRGARCCLLAKETK